MDGPDILGVMPVMVRMALEGVEDKDGGVGVVGSEGVDVDASVGAVHATGYSYCGNEAYASGRGVAGAAVAGATHGCVVPIIVDIVIGALPPPR